MTVNFYVYYEHDQNESTHHLSLSTYGAGPLTEDGRWVLLSPVGEAAPSPAESPAESPVTRTELPAGQALNGAPSSPAAVAVRVVSPPAAGEGEEGEGGEGGEEAQEGEGEDLDWEAAASMLSWA